jgi:hypothetical protein
MRCIRTRGSEIQSADTCYVSDALKRPSVVVFLHLARTGARQEGWLDSIDTFIPYIRLWPVRRRSVHHSTRIPQFLLLTSRGASSESFERLNPGCHVLACSALATQTRLLVPVRLPHIHEMMKTCNIVPYENHPAQSCCRHHFLYI